LAQATGVLLEKVRKQKTGACKSPRTSQERSPLRLTPPLGISPKKPSRKIPAAIRRAVWERDGGRCTYVSQDGRQCESREFIEFHHQVPWVRNQKHAVDNIHLRCRSHNQYAAELDFGGQHMALFRKSEEVRHAKQAKSKCQLDSNSS
jgi:5-methylcytosine-specific restriction endonuclease McrA